MLRVWIKYDKQLKNVMVLIDVHSKEIPNSKYVFPDIEFISSELNNN